MTLIANWLYWLLLEVAAVWNVIVLVPIPVGVTQVAAPPPVARPIAFEKVQVSHPAWMVKTTVLLLPLQSDGLWTQADADAVFVVEHKLKLHGVDWLSVVQLPLSLMPVQP